MMADKITSVAALLRAQQLEFIKLLIDESMIDQEIFLDALHKHCDYKGIRDTNFVSKIVKFMDDLWNFVGIEQSIFNLLISDLVMNYSKHDNNIIFINCFNKLTDLDAIVSEDYYDMLRIPRDAFFYYVQKNNLKINEEYIVAVVSGKISDLDICNWIFERWTVGDLRSSCNIAKMAYGTTYFPRVMQQICIHDTNVVMFSIIASRNSCTTDLCEMMKYISKDYDELMFLRTIVKYYYYPDHTNPNVTKLGSLLQTHDDAKKLVKEVTDELFHQCILPRINFFYDLIIPKLTLLLNFN